MKLIDADKLISEVVDVFDGAAISIDDGMAVSEFIKIIEKQPMVIVTNTEDSPCTKSEIK